MRVILLCVFIILLCSAFAIYIHIDNKHFEKSLPIVPVKEQTPLVKERTTEKPDAAFIEDDEDISEPPHSPPNRTSTAETDTPSIETDNDTPLSSALTADKEPVWTKDEEINTVPAVPAWELPPTTASNKEAIRKGLIEKHGEIPEIEQFIDLYHRSQEEEGILLDEAIVLHELLYFFYPSEANRKGLEEIKAIKKSPPIQ